MKLNHLTAWNESRREHARRYNELFAKADANLVTPFEPSWSKGYLSPLRIRVDNREAMQKALAQENIDTGIHYPVVLHLQKAYSNLGYQAGDFPVSEKAAEHILSHSNVPWSLRIRSGARCGRGRTKRPTSQTAECSDGLKFTSLYIFCYASHSTFSLTKLRFSDLLSDQHTDRNALRRTNYIDEYTGVQRN